MPSFRRRRVPFLVLPKKGTKKRASGAMPLTTPFDVGIVLGGECVQVLGATGKAGLVVRWAGLGKPPFPTKSIAPFIDTQQYHLRKIAPTSPSAGRGGSGRFWFAVQKVKGRDCEEKLRFSSRAFFAYFFGQDQKSRSPSAKRRLELPGSIIPPYGKYSKQSKKHLARRRYPARGPAHQGHTK